MASEALEHARRYEEETERRICPEERPAFHLSPRVGWMNDPNGFSFYRGEYHLFYQYHPYGSHWGPMHWGHAVSRDLLRWRHLPAALAPDMPYDRDGCFSGSAVTLPDGRQMLLYTGVSGGVQTQCLALGNGLDYDKYPENPVLDARQLPEGASLVDFRDPRIWREANGLYYAVVANYSTLPSRTKCAGEGADARDLAGNVPKMASAAACGVLGNGSKAASAASRGFLGTGHIREEEEGGQILLFRSEDGFHWQFDRKLAVNHHRLGRMWECPDFFPLDGCQVLLASTTDMLPKGLEYAAGNGTICLLGKMDARTGEFLVERDQAIDYGIDFYAAQTLLAPDGRRLMVGWMQNWDTCRFHAHDLPWFGQMTLPRELSVRGGRLCQQPVGELLACRRNGIIYEDVELADGEVSFSGIEGRVLDLEVELDVRRPELLRKFTVQLARDDRCHTDLIFRPMENVLELDREFSGFRFAMPHGRRAKVDVPDGRLRLRIILDRYSVEVFAGDGETVLTMTIYTDPSADRIAFLADGRATFTVRKYRLEL